MGYIEIHRPDGTIIYLGEPQPMHTERIEVCDVCNEPRPTYELTNVGGQTDLDAIWECEKCHGVNKS